VIAMLVYHCSVKPPRPQYDSHPNSTSFLCYGTEGSLVNPRSAARRHRIATSVIVTAFRRNVMDAKVVSLPLIELDVHEMNESNTLQVRGASVVTYKKRRQHMRHHKGLPT